jgi:ammonium transporter, Amt family
MMTRCDGGGRGETREMRNSLKHMALGALGALAALPAWAQEATGPIQNPSVEQMAGMVDKGDTTWMLVSSALVLMMSIPALALFYGGLARTKNMLSLLMQVFMIVSICAILWVLVGYSLAFTPGSPYIGGLSKAMLAGVSTGTYAATFSNNVYIPEYSFVIFQMTFACITPALIVGAFAERIKFWPLMLFVIGWSLLSYYPIAHMVWFWAGPDFLVDFPDDKGLLWAWGALDFAGGTVVHINAGIAGLVGCIVIGKRIGHNKEPMPPHSLTLTMVGASLLWVGWFGFNAGSNLESNGLAALAFLNTFVATAAATLSWCVVEQLRHGRPSLLGAVTGAVAGLVAITPASGFASPMGAIMLGLIVSPICYIFVSSVKKAFGYDDSLDVFGVHGIGGIVGAIGTGILADPSLGGQGFFDYTVFPAVAGAYDMGVQVWTQIKAVVVTVVWSGAVSLFLFYVIKVVFGLRPSAEDERQGLDQTSHGETAYNM